MGRNEDAVVGQDGFGEGGGLLRDGAGGFVWIVWGERCCGHDGFAGALERPRSSTSDSRRLFRVGGDGVWLVGIGHYWGDWANVGDSRIICEGRWGLRMAWTGKSGLAKAAAVLATILGISLGLCGLNFIAVLHVQGDSSFLLLTAYMELAGILLGAFGLLIVLVIWAWQGIIGREDG